MVYGICFCPVSKKEDLKNLKVAGKLVPPTDMFTVNQGCPYFFGL